MFFLSHKPKHFDSEFSNLKSQLSSKRAPGLLERKTNFDDLIISLSLSLLTVTFK